MAITWSISDEGSPPEPLEALFALNKRWREGAKNRDLDAMVSIYARDAQELLPGMPALVGVEEIRAFYGGVLRNFPTFSHEFTPRSALISVEGAGEDGLVVVRGSYRFTADPNDPAKVDEGKYVSVWRREDGAWRLAINISNTNA